MFIKRIWLQLSVVAFFCLLPLHAGAQTEDRTGPETRDKIGSEIAKLIASHPYRVSIFRIQPKLSVGTSYDSNVLSASGVETSDYFTAISPSGSFALKLGRRAYFVLAEDINILFYLNQDQLNDVFNTTRGTFGIGSRRILLELRGTYLKRKSRFDPEFDQPTQQRYATADLNLSIALRRKTDLHFSINSDDVNFDFVNNVVTELPLPPDTRSIEFGAGVYQEVIPEISVTFEGYSGYTEFTDLTVTDPLLTDPRANFWRVLTGFNFRGKRISGRAKVGFESRESTQTDQDKFRDLVIDTSIDYGLAKRLAIGGFVQRRRSASALLQDNFRLSLVGGVRGCVPIARALFIDGAISAGTNNYGNSRIFQDEVVTQDDFRRYDLGTNVPLPKNLIVRLGISYSDRKSNVDVLNKDRFTFNVGVGFEFGRGSSSDRNVPSCSPVSMNY